MVTTSPTLVAANNRNVWYWSIALRNTVPLMPDDKGCDARLITEQDDVAIIVEIHWTLLLGVARIEVSLLVVCQPSSTEV
jgi:hypothetical protein